MLPKLTFSLSFFLDKCIDEKVKGKFFTNKVSAKEKSSEEAKSQFFARIFSVLKSYSNYTLKDLEHQKTCFIIKDENVLKRIAEVLHAGGWKPEKITKELHNRRIYKFKIVASNIRMFGVYGSDTLYILFFDPHHLIDPPKDQVFSLPPNLTCTWCIKSCDKKKK